MSGSLSSSSGIYECVTGGALRSEKCWYTLVKFCWNDGFWLYDDKNLDSESLSATDAMHSRKMWHD